MIFTNYHTHTKFCDGLEEPRAYTEAAVAQQLKALGFSAHAPVPFPCNWTIPTQKYADYLKAIDSLKAEYNQQLEIYCGLEIDYIPELWPEMSQQLNTSRLDYFIGSIHFVGCFEDGTHWSIDGSNEEFRKGWTEIFNRDSHQVTRNYFRNIREMVKVMRPPVIGHLDKIKMQYRNDCYIPETDPLYRNELMQTLEEIAASGAIVELNTRGVYRRNEPDFYPSAWVLKEMAQLNIPVMINSDAHRPSELTLLFHEALSLLRKSKFKSIKYFSKNKWVDIGL